MGERMLQGIKMQDSPDETPQKKPKVETYEEAAQSQSPQMAYYRTSPTKNGRTEVSKLHRDADPRAIVMATYCRPGRQLLDSPSSDGLITLYSTSKVVQVHTAKSEVQLHGKRLAANYFWLHGHSGLFSCVSLLDQATKGATSAISFFS
ncbi:hypothetical protein AMECASPLE_023238 [Ameca splendens]|uniref:Uncharacterized protein n=1 Tax=Ameca splendens TaxID=208324 RepID=A0ABV0ZCW8_9TELE